MSASTQEHGHGTPDELVVIGFTGVALAVIAVGVGLALLAKFWNAGAEPDMRQPEPPAVVETAH